MRLWRFILLWLLLVLALPFAGVAAEHKLRVVTSFLPIYCFTANVAGNLATVENLLPPGAEPHDFQFTPREMRRLEEADVVVINGLGIENWLDRVIHSQEHSKALVITSAGLKDELITKLPYLDPLNPGARVALSGPPNPHIWLDPQLAKHAVSNILQALQTADPDNAAGYGKNAERYFARLDKLDADLQTGLAPLKGRPIITFHDAYPYFARRYGLNVVAVIEEVPDVQPSPRYLSALRQVIERDHVQVIFSDKQFSPRLAQQIGRDYHVAVSQLDTLETGEIKPDAYENGMRANLQTLEKNLK
jgi:zinc transport system substrate-binding protein